MLIMRKKLGNDASLEWFGNSNASSKYGNPCEYYR